MLESLAQTIESEDLPDYDDGQDSDYSEDEIDETCDKCGEDIDDCECDDEE